MISLSSLINLIIAFKENNYSEVDRFTRDLISIAEKRKQYKLAKKLREVYAAPQKDKILEPAYLQPSNVSVSSLNDHQLFEVRKSKVGIEKIVLSEVNRDILLEIINNYKKRELLKHHGLLSDSRVILSGPPGTGKTLFAYVLAGELDIPLYHVNLDSLISSYLGETGKNLKIIFDEASKQECVLFLDEFDAIAKHRDDSQEVGELKRVVTVLLQNIDELNPNTILVSATNHDHLLDPAVWRRFDYVLKMDVLDAESRKKILKLNLGDRKDLDFDLLVQLSNGLSGAIIKQWINKSLRKTVLDKGLDLNRQLVESFLAANTFGHKKLKGPQRDALIKSIQLLRRLDEKKYTYEELQQITGVPSSTLHYLTN